MSNRTRLGTGLLGLVLCSGVSAQQGATTTITQRDATGQPVIVNVIRSLSAAAVSNIANDLSARGLTGIAAISARELGTGTAAAGGGNRWNVWAAAAENRTASSFQPLRSSSDIGSLSAGVDYRISDGLLVGFALAGDRSRSNLNYVTGGGNLSGDGYTLAPYFAYVLNRSWTLDGSVGYGRSNYDVSGGGVSGSFRGTRTFGSIGLNYRQQIAGSRWGVIGRGALTSLSSRTSSFTATNNVFTDGTVSDLTQLRLGGQLAYAAGQVSPYFALTYVYDTRRPESLIVGGQTSSGDRDSWVPAIGLRFSGSGSVYGGLQLSSERGRSEVKNDQLLLNMGVRF